MEDVSRGVRSIPSFGHWTAPPARQLRAIPIASSRNKLRRYSIALSARTTDVGGMIIIYNSLLQKAFIISSASVSE